MIPMAESPSEVARLVERAVDGDQQAGASCWSGTAPACADGRPAARPAAPGAGRPLGRDPGGVARRHPAAGRIRPRARADAVLPLAAVPGRPEALEQHRRHLGAQGRDAGREISLYRGAMPEATTAALAAQLLGRQTSPSQAASRAERKIRLQEALNSMDPIDREVLVLRHFEQLSNGEAAQVLGLDKSAASKRYARALIRLKDILGRRCRGGLAGALTMADDPFRFRSSVRPRPDRAAGRVVHRAGSGAGERPSIEEYAAKYPELADEIRELLPALVELERDLSVDGAATGSCQRAPGTRLCAAPRGSSATT